MKTTKILKPATAIIIMITAVFFTACSNDDSSDEARFTFTIDRDTSFPTTAINDTISFKYNVNPNYEFDKVGMKFKYTTDMLGTLVLNGRTLSQSTEYTLNNQENNFQYVGKSSGTHEVTITAVNDKNVTDEEVFKFPYSVADFDVTYTGGSGIQNQGQAIVYTLNIISAMSNDPGGYQIKFISYDNNPNAEIYLKGEKVQLGTYYDLTSDQIRNFSVKTIPYTEGNLVLNYSIRNKSGSEKYYSIYQTINKNTISLTADIGGKTIFNPGETISLNGFIIKQPNLSNKIEYRTWFSGDLNLSQEIPTTNGQYTTATLTDARFKLDINILPKGSVPNPYGKCQLSIQVRDEFGNESEAKDFPIQIGANLSFATMPTSIINFYFSNTNIIYLAGIYTTFTAQSSIYPIDKVKYDIEFELNGAKKTYTYTDDIVNTTDLFYFDQLYAISSVNLGTGTQSNAKITNAKITITLTDTANNTVSAVDTNPTISREGTLK